MGEETKDGITPAESSTATPNQSDTAERPSSDTGDKVPWHEDKRWKEFIAEKNTLKDFKELGVTPGELKQRLQRLDYLDGLVKQAEEESRRQGEKVEPEDKERAKLIEKARKELRELAPELDEVATLKQRTDIIFTAAERKAMKTTKSIMEEHGLDTSPKSLNEMSEILADIIRGDEDLFYDYLTDTREAVKDAFGRFTKKFRDAAARQEAAEKEGKKEPLSKLPKTHTPGGGAETGGKPTGEPKDLKEASKMALKALRGG